MKKKGFTLIEVLTVITILGLLSGIVIVSVSRIIEKNRLNYYKAQEKLLKLAGQTYSEDNRNKMPKEVGNISLVKLRTLKEGFYINTIKDYKNKNCSYDNSYVLVHKKSINKYSYYAYLDCPDYKTDFNYTSNNATINIALEDASNYSNPTALVDITDSNGVYSYEYIIYRNNKEVKNSGNIENKDKSNSVSFNVKFNKLQSGTYKLTVIAYDKFGAKSVKSLGNILLDGSLPTCGSNNGSTTWTKNDRTITVECSDEGSGCSKSSFSKIFNTDTKTSTIQIEDIAGNKKDCKVNVYVDKKGPNIKIVNKSGKTDNLVFDLEDKYSGVASYQVVKASAGTYDDSKWISVNKSKATISTTQTTTDNYLVFAKDKVGNISMTAIDVQIGKAPTCEIRIVDGTKGYNGWYRSNVDIKMYTYKGDSGISNYYLNTVENPQSNADGVIIGTNKKTLSTSINYETNSITYYGYVVDKSGLYGTCSKTIKIDKTAPTIIDDNCSKEEKWYKSYYSLLYKSNLKDDLSGVGKIYHSVEGAAVVNNEEGNFYDNKTNGTSYIRYKVCDNAGNCTLTSKCKMMVDRNPPKCGDAYYYANSKWNKLTISTSVDWAKSRKIKVKCSDEESGCADSSNPLIKTYSDYGFVDNDKVDIYDNAGNKTTCHVYNINIDTIPPSIPQIRSISCNTSIANNPCYGVWKQYCDYDYDSKAYTYCKYTVGTHSLTEGWHILISKYANDFGSGVYKYQYKFSSTGTGTNYPSGWTDTWNSSCGNMDHGLSNFLGDHYGDICNIKIRAVDGAGNVSTPFDLELDDFYHK